MDGISDAEGTFAFRGIATGPDIAYLVGVRFAGVPFAARAVFPPGARFTVPSVVRSISS